MMRMLLTVALATTTLAGAQPLLAADLDQVPLIERSKLFGAPVKANGRISPDGKWLSWTAPVDGVLNVYIAPVDKPAEAKLLTAEKTRPVRQYFWAPDSTSILFIQDKGGDENFLLYGVDIASGEADHSDPVQEDQGDHRRRLGQAQGPGPRRPQQPRCQMARRP